MKFSTVPVLAITLVTFFLLAVHRLRRRFLLKSSEARAVYALMGVLGAWAIVSTILAFSGIYLSAVFVSLLPGIWLPLVPVVIAVGGFLASGQLRSALRKLVDHTGWRPFIYIQGLRVFAVGSLFKAITGDFPEYFAFLVGVPDLLFGLSAFYIARLARVGVLDRRRFIAWNLVGAGVIILPAIPLFQMGLPGPVRFFVEQPSAEALLEFPMALAPTFVVPMFVLMNGMLVWRLVENKPPVQS